MAVRNAAVAAECMGRMDVSVGTREVCDATRPGGECMDAAAVAG